MTDCLKHWILISGHRMNFECTRANQLVDNLLKIKVMTVTEMPNGTTTLSRQCYLNGNPWK